MAVTSPKGTQGFVIVKNRGRKFERITRGQRQRPSEMIQSLAMTIKHQNSE